MKKRTPEHNEKIRLSHLGKKHSEETRKKISNGNKNKKRSEKQKEQRRIFMTGRKHSEETKIKMSNSHKNKSTRAWARRGNKSNLWKGGITSLNIMIRSSLDYKLWRKAVFERDNYTCIWCGARNGNGKAVVLHADHIKPFAYFPELRFAIDNGRTLCIECHKKTDTYAGRVIKNY